jgi:hypothetical protein
MESEGAFAMTKTETTSLAILTAVFANALFAGAAVTLTVMNPRGEIGLPPIIPPSARIPDLIGWKIAIYWNGKAGGDNFWTNVESLVKQKLSGANVLRYCGTYDLGDSLAAKIAKESDAFLTVLRISASSSSATFRDTPSPEDIFARDCMLQLPTRRNESMVRL